MGANANEFYQKASLESTVSDFTGFTTREVTKNKQICAGLYIAYNDRMHKVVTKIWTGIGFGDNFAYYITLH